VFADKGEIIMRNRIFPVLLTLVFSLTFFAGSAYADELSELRSALLGMRESMEEMRLRMAYLERQQAVQFTAPSAPDRPVVIAGQDAESGTLEKLANGNLNISGFVQPYYKWSEHSSGNDTFEVRRAFVTLDGDMANNIDYRAQVDAAAGSGDLLRDAWVRYKKYPHAKIKFGQFPTPYSYEWNISSAGLDTIERAQATTTIAHKRDIGVMLEGDPALAEEAAANYRPHSGVCVRQAFVTRENINDLLKHANVDPEADLFSLDIDGNDYWIWDAMEDFRPRMAVVEFNGYFGERSVTIPYDPDFVHRAKTPRGYGGASLPAFVKLGKRKGYALIGTVVCNAYFVRADAMTDDVREVAPGSVLARRVGGPNADKVLRGLKGLELVEV